MPAWIAAWCLDTSRQRPSAIVAMISANLIAQSAADVRHIEINPESDRLLGNRKTFTFVAALRHNRMVAPLLINGAMNGETFRAYIEQFVVPILKRNDIVAIDNLPAHNVAGIEKTINAVGATLRYLPKYSPDLNRIELPYSKFKAYLRKLAARTVPSLHHAIRSFLRILKPQECAHYYKHAGYAAI